MSKHSSITKHQTHAIVYKAGSIHTHIRFHFARKAIPMPARCPNTRPSQCIKYAIMWKAGAIFRELYGSTVGANPKEGHAGSLNPRMCGSIRGGSKTILWEGEPE